MFKESETESEIEGQIFWLRNLRGNIVYLSFRFLKGLFVGLFNFKF